MGGGNGSNIDDNTNKTQTEVNNPTKDTSKTTNDSQNSSSSEKNQDTQNSSSGDKNFKFTKEWLENTTIYNVAESETCKENGGTKCFFVAVTTFKNNELYMYQYDKPERNFKTSYTLNEEKGYLTVKNKNGKERYITATGEKTADYIPVNWGMYLMGKNTTDYWYFDLEKAKARVEAENSK